MPPKCGFFVPTFDQARIKSEGLRAALHHGFKARAFYGVWQGRWGVMFVRDK